MPCYTGTGAISWFPVHCTSINNTNDLISGDNKGVASQFLEKWAAKQSMGTAGASNPGQLQVTGDFVAAFGQANVGDTSPNIQGAFCQDTGLRTCRVRPSAMYTSDVCVERPAVIDGAFAEVQDCASAIGSLTMFV